MTFVNPNILALKYKRDIETEAVNILAEYIKKYYQDSIISECKLFFDAMHQGKSRPVLSNLCCGETKIEIKCPFSINATEPNEQNLDRLYKDADTITLKRVISISLNALCKWGLKKTKLLIFTTQKVKFSIMYFVSKYGQICSLQQIWSHLLKKSVMENFISCAVFCGLDYP